MYRYTIKYYGSAYKMWCCLAIQTYRASEQVGFLLQFNLLPLGQCLESITTHAKGNLEVFITEMLLQLKGQLEVWSCHTNNGVLSCNIYSKWQYDVNVSFRFVSFCSVPFITPFSIPFCSVPFRFLLEKKTILTYAKRTHALERIGTKRFGGVRSDLYRSSRNGLARIRSIRQVTKVYSSYKRQRIPHYERMGQRMNCLAIVFAAKSSLNRFIHLPNRSGEVAQWYCYRSVSFYSSFSPVPRDRTRRFPAFC